MELVKESLEEGVYTIILNRPDKRNALNSDLLKSLKKSVYNAEKTDSSIVVLRGSGNFFSAGGDIKEFVDAHDSKARIDGMAMILNEIIKKIRTMPKIWISVIEGGIVGAGIGLALACDLTIASKSSYLNLGYRRIGLTPDGGVTIFLSRILGLKRTNELYLLSENIPIEKAYDMGLINFVVEDRDLDSVLQKLIADLKALPLHVLGPYKELINASIFPDLSTLLEKERYFVSEMADEPSFKETIKKFLTKKG
ncbi:MAG: enoyl-CoA hydratase-related protein [Desulfobacterota bacterium]|nr:enoyl-CoA hydratase-related protein [Thermodesulfobacteriota bacterium]MDW8001527.1 enoyl-CoA hydratase-related protein [Deltaproteobacteria bacterium]